MTRMLSILLALLVGIALPATPRDCCDPVVDQCHHSKAPRHSAPCEPAFSSCPEAECLTRPGVLVSIAANLKKAPRDASPLARVPTSLRAETAAGQVYAWSVPRERAPQGKLFPLNHILVI
jgi:hypothetical protein